jgi:uncharacterized membrane protein YkvA (DUF1232 family)
MEKKHEDFYIKLRSDIKKYLDKHNTKYAEILLVAPDIFHLLVKLSIDKRVSFDMKVKFLFVIAYFISPLDLLPEMILGPVGYLDDIALAAYVLNKYVNEVDPEIICELWAGDQEILTTLKKIIHTADNMLGSGLWKKIKKYI